MTLAHDYFVARHPEAQHGHYDLWMQISLSDEARPDCSGTSRSSRLIRVDRVRSSQSINTVGTATATHQEVPSASRQLPEEDFHTHGSRATRSRVEAGPSPLQSVSSVFSSEILGGCDVCIRRGPFPP